MGALAGRELRPSTAGVQPEEEDHHAAHEQCAPLDQVRIGDGLESARGGIQRADGTDEPDTLCHGDTKKHFQRRRSRVQNGGEQHSNVDDDGHHGHDAAGSGVIAVLQKLRHRVDPRAQEAG